MTTRIAGNPLALAALALRFERPMHPDEMAAILKQRHKHESIKLRYGSLYAANSNLTARGLIGPVETSRDGRWPERTTYMLTSSGRECLRDWMHELLAEPAKEFPQFEAGLCLSPALPPDEAATLLRDRAIRLAETIVQMKRQHATIAGSRTGRIWTGPGAAAFAAIRPEIPVPSFWLRNDTASLC